MYDRDLYIKDFPKQVRTVPAGPSSSYISPAVMRIISLQAAENSEKIAIAAKKVGKNYIIFGQKITRPDTTNDKWRMIQLRAGVTNFFYLYHCETGLCLARDNKLILTNVAKLQFIDAENNLQPRKNGPFGVWATVGNGRGVYLMAPDLIKPDSSKKYCVTGSGVKLQIHGECNNGQCSSDSECKTPLEFCLGPDALAIKPGLRATGASDPSINCGFCGYPGMIFGGNPIGGNVYFILGAKDSSGNYGVSIGHPNASVYAQMFCTGVVQKGNKSHDWYVLEQQDLSNSKFAVPVRSGMSLGEFFSWDPTKDVNAQFNVSRTKLEERFVDTTTQTVPKQSQYPLITAITQNPDARDCTVQYTSGEQFAQTTTINWQYIDTYASFGGDQGYAPNELKNITPENMGLQGDLSKIGPGPLSGPINGKFQPNTYNLFNYVDGKRAEGMGGRVTVPPKWMTDACHKNGVKTFGCIFFQEVYYGGKWGWWVQFCQDPELTAKRMADICQYYGFDGWLFNFETGPPDAVLNAAYPGQVYTGINQLTGDSADSYWCNVMSGSKYPTWWVNQGNQAAMDKECGNAKGWPCACTNPNKVKWPLPGFGPGETTTEQCGTQADGYTKGCNMGLTLRTNMKKVLKAFKEYRNKNNIKAELMVYDTIQVSSPYGVGISTVDPGLCPDGITNTGQCYGNWDFWTDDDGTPLADRFYSMRSGLGGGDPSLSPRGVTSTYILSSNNIVENFEPGWPLNTGPKAGGKFCPKADSSKFNQNCSTDSDCGTNGKCVLFDTPTGEKYCIPSLFTDYECNYGKAPSNITLKTNPATRPYDYYQAMQLEGITGGSVGTPISIQSLGNALANMTAKGNPQGWDSALYCGTQSKNLGKLGYGDASGNCVNEETAVERPLSSMNLYYIDTFWKWVGSYAKIPGFPSKQAITNFVVQNQLAFYTGARMLSPSNRVNTGTSADYWKGIAHYVPERSVIQSYPFYTSFSIGAGTDFWINGAAQNVGGWNDWSLQTILPTWMWWPEDKDLNDARHIEITFDNEDAYQRSNSLCFKTTGSPRSWLRTSPNPAKCNYSAPRSDCGIGQQAGCLAAGCCFDTSKPGDKPWCFHKTSQDSGYFPTLPKGQKSVTAAYRMFKTKLSLSAGCHISLVYKGGKSSSLQVGYTTNTNPVPVYLTVPVKASGEWKIFEGQIDSSSQIINTVWIKVTLPVDYETSIKLGELILSDTKAVMPPNPSVSVRDKFVTTETGSMSCVLQWKPVQNVDFYNIFQDGKLIGNLYQGTLRKDAENTPLSYSVHNANPKSSFRVRSNNKLGSLAKRTIPWIPGSAEEGAIPWMFIIVAIVYGLAVIGMYLFSWIKIPNRRYRLTGAIVMVGFLLAPVVIGLIVFLGRGKESRTKGIGSKGEERVDRKGKIEYWQDAKAHAFNACFDDSRVKCWHWLIYMWKKKKWPIKFSFFYNTLWINRDYYYLRDWIDMGHEVTGHMHDHICPCQASLSEQLVSDNLTENARLLRMLYNDPNKELMVAWPHGAFPLINPNATCTGENCGPNTGTPRKQVIDTLGKTFIAARTAGPQGTPGVHLGNTWPNPAALTGKYPNSFWKFALSPIWGWPYQIDINPGSDNNPQALCQSYIEQLHESMAIPEGMVIVAGHDFAPTDAQGKDVPCSWASAGQFTDGPYKNGSWCTDPSNCQDTFVCPKEIRDITMGCWTNPPGTPIPLYQSKGSTQLYTPPVWPPPKKFELQPPIAGASGHGPGTTDCNQCCDACWDPVPGSCLIGLFDEVTKNADLFWFAHFTEIVQYNYNRTNSKLNFINAGGNSTNYSLDCGKMYKCDITLSFGSEKPSSISLDGKGVNVYYASFYNKYYIKFMPVTNHKYTIVVKY